MVKYKKGEKWMKLVIQEIETLIEESALEIDKLEKQVALYILLNQKNYFTTIRNNIQHLLNLTYKILEEDETPILFKYINLTLLIKEIITLVETYLENKHLTLTFSGKDIYAQVNREAIERMMINLLSNAIKYNKVGGTIDIIVSRSQGNAIIEVKDSGIGISEEALKTIFEKFQREESQEEGSGLGLSIVKSLVKLHHGNITLNSKRGEGTTVQIQLPLLQTQMEVAHHKRSGTQLISLSHELKTPIHVIHSALELMQLEYKAYPNLVNQIDTIKEYGRKILNRIQIIIDLQKIKGNYFNIKLKTYNLVEVIENVMDVFSEGKEKGFFTFDPQEEEICADIDLYLIQQAFIFLMNLLVKKDATNEWYIHLEKTRLTVDSLKPISFIELIEQKQEMYKAIDKLMLEFIACILEKHQATLTLLEKQIIIDFPECHKETYEPLDERNRLSLREQMELRYPAK